MKRLNERDNFTLLEGVYEYEVNLEEQEKIMNSRWFIDWMKEYHSKSENFSWE